MRKLISFILGGVFIYLGAVTFSGNFLMWVFLVLGGLIIIGSFAIKKQPPRQ